MYMHVYENAFYPHTVIIVLLLGIQYNSETKHVSLSAFTAIHHSILNYTICIYIKRCSPMWSGRMSLMLCGCTQSQVQGGCNSGWLVFWQEIDTQS